MSILSANVPRREVWWPITEPEEIQYDDYDDADDGDDDEGSGAYGGGGYGDDGHWGVGDLMSNLLKLQSVSQVRNVQSLKVQQLDIHD